ncbi:MAG: hypothetical protein F6K10_26420 [Moorea sp. SIO2B7]|nr:hypothetical protein [Moorena sp. SIO2B7]
MNSDKYLDKNKLDGEIQEISKRILAIAKVYQGNSWDLLSLLRTLELIHREIQENLLQPSLPDNRQQLYKLLKEIEETGGWPYIERMRLQDFLVKFQEVALNTDESED